MKIPPSMTHQQVVDQIQVVVNRIAPKYTFYGYEADDLKQEAFIICMDALDRYEDGRPLENFLSVHLSNRLKNFVRDNHYTKDEEEKARVEMPGQLANEEYIIGDDSRRLDVDDFYSTKLDWKDMTHIIDIKLPAQHRADYLKIVHDVYVPKKRKEEVLQVIYDILEEHGYAEG